MIFTGRLFVEVIVTLRQLEILRAVMRYQTTIAAARMVGMSQPAVSNTIRALEVQLGFALFERINNRLFPTAAARLIHEESEPIFAMHGALEARVNDLRENKAGQIRILSTPPLGHGAIPRALQRFLTRRPRLRVLFDVRQLDDVVAGVESGAADLGFGLGLGDHPTLRVEALFDGRMVCVCRSDHPLARLPMVTPAELQGHPFIALERATRMGRAVRDSFIAARQPFNFVVEVKYCNTACVLAESGVGVSVVDPFSPASSGRYDIVAVPFRPETPAVAYVIWSARQPLSRLVESFLREVRRVVEETVPSLSQPRARPAKS